MLGLDNAGKTTILYQLCIGVTLHTAPIVGSNVEELVYEHYSLITWNVGGQEMVRSTWPLYCANAELVILVVDSSDAERLSVITEELHTILSKEYLSNKAPLLIYANKQDVEGSLTPIEIIHNLNLTSIKEHNWQVQGCCALTGEGLYQGLKWISINLKTRLEPRAPVVQNNRW